MEGGGESGLPNWAWLPGGGGGTAYQLGGPGVLPRRRSVSVGRPRGERQPLKPPKPTTLEECGVLPRQGPCLCSARGGR